MTARVVVFDPYIDPDWTMVFSKVMESEHLEFIVPESTEVADEAIRAADVVIATGRRKVDAAVLDTLEHAVGILCLGVGKDQVDQPAASERGIEVRNVPDYCTREVADHALTLLLAAQRRLIPLAASAKAGMWNVYGTPEVDALRRLDGQTLGVIGAGRIGALIAQRAAAFGFELIAYDPFVRPDPSDLFEHVTLDELAARSDAIVVSAALTPESRHTIDADFLGKVREGVIIVNVARGGLIDEDALLAALERGTVAVAALDVRAKEPPDPATDALAGRPDVIVTPHLGGTSVEAFDDLLLLASRTVRSMLQAAGRIPDEAAA